MAVASSGTSMEKIHLPCWFTRFRFCVFDFFIFLADADTRLPVTLLFLVIAAWQLDDEDFRFTRRVGVMLDVSRIFKQVSVLLRT